MTEALHKPHDLHPREDNLPKWVQSELTALRRALAEATAELVAIKSGTVRGPFKITTIDHTPDFFLPHMTGGWLEYETEHTRLRLNDRDGFLEIMDISRGSFELEIRPRSSNVVLVRSVPPRNT